jgi:hypothetical protein
MNRKNTEKLWSKYPAIFAGKDRSIQESLIPFGLECGDGWYWLIDNLCDCMQRYIDSNNVDQVEATQVKEKFGTLSFYTYGGDDMTSGMVWLAESMSGEICEMCGSTENVTQTKGWIRTVCNNCVKEK